MKKNMFTLLFGLLLAVGWTNVASAQALPGNYADRMGITDVNATDIGDIDALSKASPLQVRTIQHGPSVAAKTPITVKAPLRANNKPDVVYPKSYYDTLMYTWVDDNNVSHTDSATKIATDPNQMYELLRFVYMDPRFPGPYYSAYNSAGGRERKVYYGGVAGGWNIPFEAQGTTPDPVGDITFTVGSGDVNIQSITVTCDGNAVTWNANTANYTTVTYNGNQRGAFDLPNGWTLTSGDYVLRYKPSGSTNAYGYIPGGGTITIETNGATYVTVDVVASTDDTSQGITVNNESKTLTSSEAPYNWSFGTPSTSTTTYTKTIDVIGDITFTGNGNSYAYITKIEISSGNTVITSFTASTSSTTVPAGWTFNNAPALANDGSLILGTNDNNQERDLIVTSDILAGCSQVTVSVTAYNYPATQGYSGNTYPGYVYVNGSRLTSYTSSSVQTRSTTVSGNPVEIILNNPDVYVPNEEGYTALIVSLKNKTITAPETYPENDHVNSHNYYNSKDSIVEYLRRNVRYIQLLTDGLRIGEGEGEGTVFNCSGTYNKFFFLGKGQAREKDDLVLLRQQNFGYLLGERVPFKEMFEEFSPTSGDTGSQITDFYLEMMDGSVYDVVHDCASVIEMGHQFSMSGNKGTQDYAMSGMNFFIPDYRLKYWEDEFSYKTFVVNGNDTIYTTHGPWTVDGRIMNPFKTNTGVPFRSCPNYTANTAQYIKAHAPKVGIYILTLDAEAQPCDGYANPGNTNYTVTLDWTSSLNEMSGKNVPQTYVIYEVTVDSLGVEHLDSITTVYNTTHYDFDGKLWPQTDHSQTHTYIIKGWPTDNYHPEFVAWSNEDAIVIPGLKDFLSLDLDHYESDFDVPNMQNWYRNFMNVNNEDELNGLTTDRIYEGYNVFYLMRYADRDSTVAQQVAKIVFENQSDGTVKYTIFYVDENNENTQDIEAPKYELSAMNIPVTGYLTVVNDGDIIIQPNGYDVNFLSITVSTGTGYGSYNQTWTAPNALPNNWIVSDGSHWVLENGAYYLEGGGYILIPANVLGNYNTVTVTINAYGDPGKTAKIKVNGTPKAILNGEENARDYEWIINNNN